MKPKLQYVDGLPDEMGTRCVPILLPDNDELVTLFLQEAFKYLSSPSYFFAGDDGKTARSFEIAKIKNLTGAVECMNAKDIYSIPPECVGQIKVFASGIPPANHLRCDGAEYSKIDYPELYERIHPVFKSGDKFRVPDMRDRVATDGAIGSVAGANYRLQNPSEVGVHRHSIDADTQVSTAQHNHGGATQVSGAPHNHGGATQVSDAPHNHGGLTSAGLATFYRTLGTPGTRTEPNHVTGFDQPPLIDKTDDKWPLSTHRHSITTDNAPHSHTINIDLIEHSHVIETDFAPHSHTIVTLTENHPLDTPQTAMDMRQETLSLEHYICCASERITDMSMYYLRRNGSAIEQTRNGGADWTYLFDVCECGSNIGTNPTDGTVINSATVVISRGELEDIGNAVVNDTYNEGDFGGDSTYSDTVINNAICAAATTFVISNCEVLADTYRAGNVEICDEELVAAAGGILASIIGTLATINPALGVLSLKVAAGVGIVLAICEIAEEIARIINNNPAFLRNNAARVEVICAINDAVKAPIRYGDWSASLIGFTGSEDAERIASLIAPLMSDPGVYGVFFQELQPLVEQANNSPLPCPCGTEDPCSPVFLTWQTVPLTPPLPSGWKVAPSLEIFAPYGTSPQVNRAGNGDLVADGFNADPQTTLAVLYEPGAPCYVSRVTCEYEVSANSYRCAIYVKNAVTQNWVLGVAQVRSGPLIPLRFELVCEPNIEIDGVVFTCWTGHPRITRTTIS